MSAPPGHTTTPTSVIDRARNLLAPHTGLHTDLYRLTRDDVRPLPEQKAPPVAGWVDGALAREQTHVLVWAAAVAATAPDRRGATVPDPVRATFVAPVGRTVEPAVSALMGALELVATARTLDAADGLVCIDGGTVTALLSVLGGLMLPEDDTAAALIDDLTALDLDGAIVTYINGVLEGRVVALPKQDTATGYATEWSRRWATDLGQERARTLGTLRDRPLVTPLLAPGEYLVPRPAQEVGRSRVKLNHLHPAIAAHVLGGTIDNAFDDLGSTVDDDCILQVGYFAPRHLPGHVVKIETAAPDAAAFGQVCARIDESIQGPRIREPLGQYEVDVVCKRAVTSDLSALVASARHALGDGAATTRYRT